MFCSSNSITLCFLLFSWNCYVSLLFFFFILISFLFQILFIILLKTAFNRDFGLNCESRHKKTTCNRTAQKKTPKDTATIIFHLAIKHPKLSFFRSSQANSFLSSSHFLSNHLSVRKTIENQNKTQDNKTNIG